MKLCECGCGQEVTIYRAKPRKFISGHNFRGKKNPKTSIALLGHIVSEKSREKISIGHVGKVLSEETKKKLSLLNMGSNNPNFGHTGENCPNHLFGKQHLKKTKNKMSIAHRQLWTEPEYQKMMLKSFSKGGNIQGIFHSVKNSKDVSYRSSYELKFMQQLESDFDVASYQYEEVYIPYEINGEERFTIPDFLVTFVDGHQELVEVKSEWCLEDKKVQLKLAAMRNYAREQSWKFNLVTEKELKIGVYQDE